MTDENAYRYHSMEGRRIRVQQWLSTDEAIRALRGHLDAGWAAARAAQIAANPTAIEIDPVPVPIAVKPLSSTIGLTSAPEALSDMTVEAVNLLAPGVDVEDKRVVGSMVLTGGTARVFRNCLLVGTETLNVLSDDSRGNKTVSTVNSPRVVLSGSASGTPAELYNCEVMGGDALLDLAMGSVVQETYLHDAGRLGVVVGFQRAGITITDVIIDRIGNLDYSAFLGMTPLLQEAIAVSIEGQGVGISAALERVVFDCQDPNTSGGPSGDQWAYGVKCVSARALSGEIEDLSLTNCWFSSGAPYAVSIKASLPELIKSYSIIGCEFARTTTVGPAGLSEALSSTVTSNVDAAGADINALVTPGGSW